MARARRPSLFSPIALARRSALYKGLLGGNRGWMAVGVVVWGPRLLKKAMGRTEQVLATEKMVAGDTMTLYAIPPPTRKERKAARRVR